MSRSSPPPGYQHIGGNVFVAKVITPGNRDRARARPKPTSGPAQAVIEAYCTARIDAVAGKGKDVRGLAQANMRRQLAADGMKPVSDPGAGLSPARASMARIVAQSSH